MMNTIKRLSIGFTEICQEGTPFFAFLLAVAVQGVVSRSGFIPVALCLFMSLGGLILGFLLTSLATSFNAASGSKGAILGATLAMFFAGTDVIVKAATGSIAIAALSGLVPLVIAGSMVAMSVYAMESCDTQS